MPLTIGTVVAARIAARSIRLSTGRPKANAEAVYLERRIDFHFDRLRALSQSIEGPQRGLRVH